MTYFKAADRDRIHRRIAEARADAELKAAAGDLDHAQIARALHAAIEDGSLVKYDDDDGTSTVEMADGSPLDLSALVAIYATDEHPRYLPMATVGSTLAHKAGPAVLEHPGPMATQESES